jgi:alpha-amylase/alpha-mannosidase (GH57 family)
MSRYICIHGHYYQPPRENAWLEEIETQESASPYHDWNERITAECYGPNSVSRVLDEEQKIIDITNNYGYTSFNFGPTLLSWMQKCSPKAYQGVLEGDRESRRNFGGHGSAMAQVYNHIIMPLANTRDKETQIVWGLRDFEYHFGRKAEGMWLAETAVDTETLEFLAKHHVKFTVLAPRQAKCFRKIGTEHWHHGIETHRAYLCKLPSGKSITLFFYDGEVAQAVAFKGLLKDGRQFAHELLNRFNPHNPEPQLVHIATDGESYGHHHKHGDMALAYCLRYIQKNDLAQITNYSQYLSLVPKEFEAQIHENSSWSCVHGVERWRSNCGCKDGEIPYSHQEWRAPLRNALDWLRDELAEIYEKGMKHFHKDPWHLRNEFIEVLLDRSSENTLEFIYKHTGKELDDLQNTQFLRLLEMQRQSLLMFTSCAWFFDEISRIEATQVLQYANRALQLGERSSGKNLEIKFLELLKEAPSNLPAYGNGAEIYTKQTMPARVTLKKVGMHYAVTSLFTENPDNLHILNYDSFNQYFERLEAGIQRMAIGRTTVYSRTTMSQQYFSFLVIYLGQHHIFGGSSEHIPSKEFYALADKVKRLFEMGDIPEILKLMHDYFPETNFSIWDLFKDEKIKVFNKILSENLIQAKNFYQQIYNRNYNLLTAMQLQGLILPAPLLQNMQTVISQEMEDFFDSKSTNTIRLMNLAQDVEEWHVQLNKGKIGLSAGLLLLSLAERFSQDPTDIEPLEKFAIILPTIRKLGIHAPQSQIQDLMFKLGKRWLPEWKKMPELVSPKNLTTFMKVCDLVNLRFI